MEALSNISFFSQILWLTAAYGCYLVFIIWRGRCGLRTIEAINKTTLGTDHNPLIFNQLPAELRKMISEKQDELEEAGFVELLTGARFKLSEGGADSYYRVWRSSDGESVIELQLTQVPRVFAIFPVPLPFRKSTGRITVASVIESFFDDGTTLISDSGNNPPIPDLPFVIWNRISVQEVSPSTLIEQHVMKLTELKETGKLAKVLKSETAFFEKENRQREMIAAFQEQDYKVLRETNNADIWDPKGEVETPG